MAGIRMASLVNDMPCTRARRLQAACALGKQKTRAQWAPGPAARWIRSQSPLTRSSRRHADAAAQQNAEKASFLPPCRRTKAGPRQPGRTLSPAATPQNLPTGHRYPAPASRRGVAPRAGRAGDGARRRRRTGEGRLPSWPGASRVTSRRLGAVIAQGRAARSFSACRRLLPRGPSNPDSWSRWRFPRFSLRAKPMHTPCSAHQPSPLAYAYIKAGYAPRASSQVTEKHAAELLVEQKQRKRSIEMASMMGGDFVEAYVLRNAFKEKLRRMEAAQEEEERSKQGSSAGEKKKKKMASGGSRGGGGLFGLLKKKVHPKAAAASAMEEATTGASSS